MFKRKNELVEKYPLIKLFEELLESFDSSAHDTMASKYLALIDDMNKLSDSSSDQKSEYISRAMQDLIEWGNDQSQDGLPDFILLTSVHTNLAYFYACSCKDANEGEEILEGIFSSFVRN